MIGRLVIAWGCAMVCSASILVAAEDSLTPQIVQVQADVEIARKDLNAVRDRIAQERLALQAEHRALEARVLEKRERESRLLEARRMAAEQRSQLEQEVKQLDGDARFVLMALSEYRRGTEMRLQLAERQAYQDGLATMDRALSSVGAAESAGTAAALVLSAALDWNIRRIGGYGFDGTALGADGVELDGRYLVFGPQVYFRSDAGEGALVSGAPGRLLPAVYPGLGSRDRKAVAALVNGSLAVPVPVDGSRGAALRRAQLRDSVMVEIRKGGFVMIPLLATGVLSLLIMLWKSLRLRSLRRAVATSLDPVMDPLQSRDWVRAEAAARGLRQPLASLIGDALAHRQAAKEHLEEILHERLLSMVPIWESHLGTLAVFGAVAPLLGLLGTVTGMMHTFELVNLFGTGDAKLLSGGISEALITTKFGLGIAIPVLVSHAFLSRRLRVIISTLEGKVARFITVLGEQGRS